MSPSFFSFRAVHRVLCDAPVRAGAILSGINPNYAALRNRAMRACLPGLGELSGNKRPPQRTNVGADWDNALPAQVAATSPRLSPRQLDHFMPTSRASVSIGTTRPAIVPLHVSPRLPLRQSRKYLRSGGPENLCEFDETKPLIQTGSEHVGWQVQ